MEKKVLLRNIITSFILQAVTIINGFVLPKIILSYFGSATNGLVSSISQFLSYIQLLEGGLGGVIMAALYKPLSENDMPKVSGIVNATRSFFRKIAFIYVVYAIGVAFIYPIFIKTGFTYEYSIALILVLGINMFVQYYFSVTLRTLINADRKGYYVSLTQTVLTVMNLIVVILTAKYFRDILIIKLASALVFCIQPILYTRFVREHYDLDKNAEKDSNALQQRWSGFGINLAYFVHTNTDVVVLTILASLTDVSVYAVYAMVVKALKNLVISVSNAALPSFGKILASGDKEKIDSSFDYYEFGMQFISTLVFTCSIILITSFVGVYTKGVTDANYYQPLFGGLLVLSEMLYCFRDPYISATYAAGAFKDISKYAYWEAISNIVLSVILVKKYGIIGVAIGTVFSMALRMFLHIYYLRENILFRPMRSAMKNIVIYGCTTVLSIVLCNKLINLSADSYLHWAFNGLLVFIITGTILLSVSFIFYRKHIVNLLKSKFRK